eukprot:Hpha_TRINITY_DN15522_c1_g9::TRINITY_DN15522_c1_g9_i1::g.108097::m.108097/K10737/MCM8; DNA helicase MCM8
MDDAMLMLRAQRILPATVMKYFPGLDEAPQAHPLPGLLPVEQNTRDSELENLTWQGVRNTVGAMTEALHFAEGDSCSATFDTRQRANSLILQCKALPVWVQDILCARDVTTITDGSSPSGQLEDIFSAMRLQQQLRVLACAVHCVLCFREVLPESADAVEVGGKPQLQLVGVPITPVRAAPRAVAVGALQSYKGTVVRMSSVQPLCVRMRYRCQHCDATTTRDCVDGVPPDAPKCTAQECRDRARRFFLKGKGKPGMGMSLWMKPAVYSDEVKWENHQRIKLQLQGEGAGRVPPTVDVELRGALCDKTLPGDVVTATGVLKKDPMSMGGKGAKGSGGSKGKGGGQGPTLLRGVYLECCSVERAGGSDASERDSVRITPEDAERVEALATENDCFSLLVHSLAPFIHGHELVKAGLVLALLGGVRTESERRGDVHMMMVGDPGVGKSQLLRACAEVAPRGVYVCGNSTTASGLTVTLQRDVTTGDSTLEAGALVLGDQGATCIDEFDKMERSEYASLLEAMEQQRISVAKAGAVGTLPARTCVLAAANPRGGHYDDGQTVAQNLRLSPALLSRFDLIFVLKDSLRGGTGGMIARHVLEQHGAAFDEVDAPPDEEWEDEWGDEGRRRISLEQSLLEWTRRPARPPLDAAMLRKYIAYARRTCTPELTPEASAVLKSYFMSLRRDRDGRDAIRITARSLESLIRLSQARAKAELKKKVSEAHAEDVVELMSRTLYQRCTDVATGAMDCMQLGGEFGVAAKPLKLRDRVLEGMRSLCQTEKKCFTVSFLQQRFCKGETQEDLDRALEYLMHAGYLLRQSGGKEWQLV